jgi:hypothetical protein
MLPYAAVCCRMLYWLMILVAFVEVPSVIFVFNIIDLPTSEGCDQLMFRRYSILLALLVQKSTF